jgi:hypothetical protein
MSIIAFWMLSEGNAPKKKNQQVISHSQECYSTLVGFGQGFLIKEQYDNTGASPTLLTSLQLIFTCSLD